MKRGKVYFATLDPTVGSKIAKKQTVVIVSNDLHNRKAPIATVIPLTSNVSKVYPFEVFLDAKLTRLPKDSKAMPQQVRTIAKQRIIGDAIALLNAEVMGLIENALKLHLGMS